MISPNELTVRLYGLDIGTVTRSARDEYTLEYRAEWASSAAALPISQSLPLVPRRHVGASVAHFLDNLLPDNTGVRERWAREADLASDEPFLLLSAYGNDVAGALQFVRRDATAIEPTLRSLGEDAIADRIAAIHADSTAWVQTNDDTGRFSLGGAQGKFALALHEGAWYEPSGAAPATHIFKPLVERFADADIIEYVTMKAASAAGLPTAAVTLQHFGSQRSLVVERFDRQRLADGSVQRLHQEDMLQALGRPRLQKYESDGGPTYRDILALLDSAALDDARQSKAEFARALAFSWLMLSTDGHAKNYTVFLQPDSLHLAPLYDVSSLIPYLPGDSRPQLEAAMADAKLALAILGTYRVGDASPETWLTIARDAKIAGGTYLDWVRDLCDRIADLVQEEIARLPQEDQTPVVELFRRRIRIRATQASRALA